MLPKQRKSGSERRDSCRDNHINALRFSKEGEVSPAIQTYPDAANLLQTADSSLKTRHTGLLRNRVEKMRTWIASNKQDELCFNCNSCKEGVLNGIKKQWKLLAIISICARPLLLSLLSTH